MNLLAQLAPARLWLTIGVAFRALRRNSLRSALTALGIIIGVSSVVAMVAIGTRVESGKDWIGSRAHSRSMSINDCPHRGNRQRRANFRFFKSMHQSHAGWNACLSLEQF